ncbi:hypothetical protein KR222_003107 [Zaprionus bogoriensis]|nr:hypothetical protein KR222_003107 [Zaprionus bogoriensis]
MLIHPCFSKADNGLLKYVPGNFYEYSFESILSMALNAGLVTEADDTSLKVSGTAKVFASGNCGYTLQVGVVKVINTKESVDKTLVMNIQRPVHFTWTSGQVEPELCADASDSSYSLNIKRAIISLLQTGESVSGVDIDVFGQCNTHTSSSKSGNEEVVTKVRNLNHCKHREHINNGLLSGIVNEKAGVTSTSVLQSDYRKETHLEHGLVQQVQLVELYKFSGSALPAKASSDVNVKVVTSLKLKNPVGTPGAAPSTGSQKVSLIFQQPDSYAVKNIVALKAALSELIDLTQDYIKNNSAQKFVELIRLLRHSDTETLLELAAFPHPNKDQARKVYLDALFRTNTANSARAILKQLGKFQGKEKLFAVLSLNLIESVDKETLSQATAQNLQELPKEIYLALGNLVAKYCARNACQIPEIEHISRKFVEELRHCKPETQEKEERIVFVLKGIGNAKSLTKSVETALIECASPGRSNRIRVAALQAFSTSSCSASLNAKSLELLKDQNEDSELRIEAYLAAINCPSEKLANHIAEIVNSEQVNQVGGFIESNLRALRDSTDAGRADQRFHLGNIHVTKQFPRDYRRYSYNSEVSYKLDAFGLSASSDYKLIYSQHGFLPRSARLNFTSEIFGNNFNIFEASVRQENLETLLEHYIGPKGLLNKDFDDIVKIIEGNGEISTLPGRARRSLADDVARVAKKYKTYGSKNNQDINLDVSLKLFGSEMAFLSLGDNVPKTLPEIITYFSTGFDKTKKQLSTFNKQFSSHQLFLDAELSYPTGMGVPLELVAQGFAANKFDLAVNLDLNDVLEQNWQRAKYRFKLVPSIDLSASVQLKLNAQVLSTGLQIISSAHSATGSDLSVSLINNGDGFNVEVELPREKLELIDVNVKAEFFVAEQDKALKSVPLKPSKKQRSTINTPNEFCLNQLEIVGVNFCVISSTGLGEATGGQLEQFHLSKPFAFSVYVTAERKFNFKGTHTSPSTGNQKWKLAYSTPGSKISHNTDLTFELGTKSRTYGRLSLDNPQYHLALEGGLLNSNQELVIYGQYEQDQDIKKSKIGFSKSNNEYRPLIEIQDKTGVVNNIYGYRADGKIVVQKTDEKQTRYNFQNFQIFNQKNERIVVNGWADVGPSLLSTELHVEPNQQLFLINSNIKLDNGHYAVGLFVTNERESSNVYGGSAELSIRENSYALKLVSKVVSWTVTSASQLEYAKTENSPTVSSYKFSHNLSVEQRNKNVSSVSIISNLDVNKFQLEVEAQHEQRNSAAVTVKYQSNKKSVHDYELVARGRLNQRTIEILSKCDANGNLLVVDHSLSTSWGTLLSLKGNLGQRYSVQDIHVDLYGSAKLIGTEKPIQWTLKILGTPEKTTSEFHIKKDSVEQLTLTAESQHPLDKISAGKLNLSVRNLLAAKADFKVSKIGKGELVATVESQKSDLKHKLEIESKFHIQSPKYDVEASILLDGKKKLTLKTENQFEKTKLTTKNTLEVDETKWTFDANGNVKAEWRTNGDVQGSFALSTPNGRIIDGNIKRHVTTNPKTHVTQGTAELHVNDQQPNTGKKRSISLKGKLDRLNLKTKEFSANSQLIFTDFSGKQAELTYHVNHLPNGQNKALDFAVSLQGNLVNQPHPLELSVVIDEYSDDHAIGRVSAKVGPNITANLNGNYHVGQSTIPSSYELKASLQIPESKIKSWELSSRGKVLKPLKKSDDAYNFEFVWDSRTGDGQFAYVNTLWKGTAQQGIFNFETKHNNLAPFKFDGSYQYSNGKRAYAINASYGEKYVKSSADISYDQTDLVRLHLKLDTSFASVKDIELSLLSQQSSEDSYVISIQAKQSEKSYGLESQIFFSSYKKGFNLQATLPDNQPIALIVLVEVKSERKIKLTLDIDNLVELDLKLNLEASYISIDDFYLLIDWNSKKLGLNNYVLDVKAQTKSMKLLLKKAQDIIVSGTANYNLKKELNRAIIEGQGQLQFNGKTNTGNFKLIHQNFELSNEKEIGFAYTFNGNFGSKNAISTLKLTNKEFNSKVSICEEKKQCINIQLQSTMTIDEQKLNEQQLGVLVLVDLRELGYPYELEWKSKTIRQGFKYQYNLDGRIFSNDRKYHVNAKFLPNVSNIELNLPNRQIVFELTQQLPSDGKIFGNYQQSAAIYIDKVKRPNDVARVLAQLDLSGVHRTALNARGLLKVEHPYIRALSISGHIDANRDERFINSEVIFDIFRSPDQKVIASSQLRNIQPHNGFNITTLQQLRSTGLQFQYEINSHASLSTERNEISAATEIQSSTGDLQVGASIFAAKDRVELLVTVLNEQFVSVTSNFNLERRSAKTISKLQAFGQKPVEILSEIQPTWIKILVKRQSQVEANAEIKLGKELKIDVLSGGNSLLNGRVALDGANFLQTNYKTNDDDIKGFLESVEADLKKETEAVKEKLKRRFERVGQDFDKKLKLIQASAPDFAKLISGYNQQFKNLVTELEADPALANLIKTIRTLLEKLHKFTEETTKVAAEYIEKVNQFFADVNENLQGLWKNSLSKAWEQLVVSTTKLLGQIQLEFVNAYTKTFKGLLDWLEKHGSVLKSFGKVIYDVLSPFNEVLQEVSKVVVHTVDSLVDEIKEYIASLPKLDTLRDELIAQIKKLKLVEKSLELLNNIFTQLHILPQTPESNELLQKLQEYLETKLKQQSINDEKWLNELSTLLVKALRSLWSAIEKNSPVGARISDLSENHLDLWTGVWPQSLEILTNLSAFLSFRSSAINYILNENWESIIKREWLKSWIFFQNFELRGTLVNGQHIFSFDGQAFAFPGNCRYILAQDSVNNNFTVIGQLNESKLKTIILIDRDGNFIEVSDTAALKVNGKPVEYPQHLPGIHAWRRFYTVHLHSEYGATVVCTTDLKVCHVTVNGFYTSKTRGLLGNGNAEPYDDNLLIDGKLAPETASLVNDYSIGKCPVVTNVKEPVENLSHQDICSEMFGIESPLALNYLILDVQPYRKACDSAVQKASEKEHESIACTFALAYGSALKLQHIWVLLPSRCLRCAGSAGQRELNDEFTLKIPTNKADVVFVVDINVTPRVLDSLVAPAITEIRESLKNRGITDVQVGVVAFDESKRYPALLTSDNGKLNYKGNFANVHLNGPKNFCDNCVEQIISEKHILDLYKALEHFLKTIVPQSDEKAFYMALDYPFRAGASKSIIGVRSNALEYKNWWKFVRAQITGSVTNFDGALLHLIAPVEGLALDGVPVEKLVGFNSRLVATLDGKDNKKRTKLQFENDMGIDFVLNNGGWVFNTQHFDKLKPTDQKKALNQVTSSIADSLFKTEIVSECRCLPVHGLHGQHKCSIKSSSFLPNKKPKAK